MSKNLSIIIVNWNGIKVLPACLNSIVEYPPSVPFEVVVVDNDSSDESVQWLRSDEAKKLLLDLDFKLIESKENLGFGRANNKAFDQTATPFVFLLNPDTLLTPGAIDKLLETVKSDQRIGLVAPRLIDPNGFLYKNAWAFPNAARTIVEGLKLYKFFPLKYRQKWLLPGSQKSDEQRDVPMVSGAAMLVRRDTINSVGAFNDEIFMYGEDAEWCYRIGRGNWRIVLEPKAEIIHIGGQSSKQLWDITASRMKEEEAFLDFQQRCFSPMKVLANTIARFFVLSIYYLFSMVKGEKNLILKKVIILQRKSIYNLLGKIFGFTANL